MSFASKAWLTIVGIGADGTASLGMEARAVTGSADVLVGGERHLSLIPRHSAERIVWESPIATTIQRIAALRGRRVVVLASGDPMSFGIGAAMARRFEMSELRVIPTVGSVALACARLLWPEESVTTVSLCGRPPETLALHLAPGARLVVLSADGTTPAMIAGALVAHGFGPSSLHVFESLGGADERAIAASADRWTEMRVGNLNIVAVECRPAPDTRLLSRAPGLPDEAFVHDGQITKREMRALAISALAPLPGQRLWDVGAGCGSVAIEWLRAAPHAEAIAIERNPERAAIAARNAKTLGVPALDIVQGEAPDALAGLAAPDAVFVGGGVSQPGVLDAAWHALRPGGRLVAHAVSVEGEARLSEAARTFGGRLTRIGIERAEPLGGHTGFRPARAVTQLIAEKAARAS
jgi:precorrin-6B C5,15-methyltransferase / cobalt-precorrin-6B C5,C15-methyltransferase